MIRQFGSTVRVRARATALSAAIASILLLAGSLTSACSADGSPQPGPDAPDHLPNDWVNSVAIVDEGVLWVGTNGGLSRLDAGEWTIHTAVP
jgi:ligand-binding sensor domain-containing protein